jgi:ATP-dependent Clp protease ATP-binding subunit ClpC
LNRIDDVIVFNSLDQEDIFRIIDITLKDLYKRIQELGYSLELDEEAKTFLAKKGYDPQFGARPLNRAIQKYLEDPLAEFILNNQATLEDGATLVATLGEDDQMIITVKEDKK